MAETSAELREWAGRCAAMADTVVSDFERNQLMRKSDALRALADTEDWLAGRQLGPATTAREPAGHALRR